MTQSIDLEALRAGLELLPVLKRLLEVAHASAVMGVSKHVTISANEAFIIIAALEAAASLSKPPIAGDRRAVLEELEDWRSCAKFDVTMEGAVPAGWDRSALERCRKKYLAASPAPVEAGQQISKEAYELLTDSLENPPEPSPELIELMRGPTLVEAPEKP